MTGALRGFASLLHVLAATAVIFVFALIVSKKPLLEPTEHKFVAIDLIIARPTLLLKSLATRLL